MACVANPMGFLGQSEWGDFPSACFKSKFRWKLIITDVSGEGIGSLPPLKSARPNFTFKEMEAQHLTETIYFPSKPEWKPVNLTLYDIVKVNENPVFTWIKRAYNPKNCSGWFPALDSPSLKCAEARLVLYDGCGTIIEEWIYEHAYPQAVEFGDLDMSSSEVVVCEVTLRYDRAYIKTPATPASIGFITTLPNYTCASAIASFTAAEEIPDYFSLGNGEEVRAKLMEDNLKFSFKEN